MGITPGQMYAKESVDKSGYSNAVDPISAIAEGVGSIFDFGSTLAGNSGAKKEAERQAEIAAEAARARLIENSMSGSKNTIALVIVGGVFLIGGVAVFFALKK